MILTVFVKPGSKKESVDWLDESTIKLSVKERPEKGRANKAVVDLLAKTLSIPKTQIEITRGKTTRIKQVKIKK